MVKFSDIFDFQCKSDIKAGDGLESGKYPFFTSSREQSKYRDDFSLQGDSLIFGTGGEASIHFNNEKFSVSTDCLVAQPKTPKKHAPKYYYYFLKGNIRILEKGFKGAGLKHISKGYISQIDLPESDFQLQKQVVEILDSVEFLRQKREQSLQLLDDFLRATFLDSFGDPLTNSKGILQKRIGDLGQVITGNTPSRQKSEYYGNYTEWIKSDNINTPQFILTQAKEYLSKVGAKIGRIAPSGSVLVTCIAGTPSCIGNVAMTDRDVAFNQQINAFVPGKAISQKVFFAQILFCKQLIRQASTNSMKGMVSKGKFSEIKILVPPKEHQSRFDEIFDKIASMRTQYQLSASELNNQLNALTQKYFDGK